LFSPIQTSQNRRRLDQFCSSFSRLPKRKNIERERERKRKEEKLSQLTTMAPKKSRKAKDAERKCQSRGCKDKCYRKRKSNADDQNEYSTFCKKRRWIPAVADD
jgi:hypothetical protein